LAINFDDLEPLKKELEQEYALRHQAHHKLREFWHGRYWKDIDSQTHGIASLFRDATAKRSDVGPDLKLVRNLLFDVCVKYQTFMSQLPMIRTFVDQPDSRRGRAQATLKERVLYGLWWQGEMSKVLNRVAWYLPLMGDCFLGAWPDFDRNLVTPLVRSPEYAFPVMGVSDRPDAYIFAWKWPTARAKRAFPDWTPTPTAGRGSLPIWSARKSSESDKYVEIVEYSSDTEFSRFINGQRVNGIEHNLGFNLFEQVPFINVPDSAWNHGAVEQSVNLVEAGNAVYSLVMQAMLENVFPRLILEDPMKFPEEIDTGAGAVIGVNPGGRAYFLEPPAVALNAGMEVLHENERSIKQDTSMPDVNFGQFNASIITGKAINELQGAGTGSLVDMVQGAGIGSALSNWNDKALTILRRQFAKDKIYLYGMYPRSMADIRGSEFSMTITGSKIVGSTRNEVVFSPYMNEHDKLIMGLQGLGAGLFSKSYVREQVGVSDNDAMVEEIVAEALDDGIVGMLIQQLQAEPTPENEQNIEQQVNAYLAAATPGPAGPPHPLLAAGPGAQAGTPPTGAPPGPGGPPPGPQGAPTPQATPQQAPGPQGGPQPVSVAEAISAFQAVQGIQGKVYLAGEIVVRGQTSGDIEVFLTVAADRQTLSQGLPQYAGRLVFHSTVGEPKERFIDVTPGAPAQPGGAEKQTPEALAGVFQQ
jgi:hypothetical protein